MFRSKVLAVVLVVLAMVSGMVIPLYAADDVELEKIVVTPYLSNVSEKEDPSSTDVIDVGEDESVGKLSFVDAIKGLQGVDYAIAGGLGGVSRVYIRGADA
ncbi:MAG: hypothetical protein PHW98_04920 [Candidatus Omnitrophica bacterium]|nr:hypothetical protein [Candidatus Omnitrophota bacterium]